MTRSLGVRHLALLIALPLGGCSRYSTMFRPDALPAQVAPNERVEVWSHGTARHLDRVTITPDSLHGKPWWQPPECDSCWVTLARADIDSVRTRQFDGAASGALFVGVLPFAAYGLLWLMLSGSD